MRGYVLYASDDSDASRDEAIEYVRSNGFTNKQVSIRRKNGQIIVVSLVDLFTPR